MIEAEAIVLHGADGDGVVAFGVGEDDGLFAQAADGEDGRFGLIDDGRAEFAAKDAGVGEREGGAATSSGRSFLVRARRARSAMVRARSTKVRFSADGPPARSGPTQERRRCRD